jgi:competence protein ComEC
MRIEKLTLFENRGEFFLYLLFIVLLFSFNLYKAHERYLDFKSKKFQDIEVRVLNQYKKSKNSKSYHVLKLKSSDGFIFYTTSREDIKDLRDRELIVGVITDRVDFFEFLKGFYAPTYNLRLLEKRESFKEKLKNKIDSMHESPYMRELFNALFLATPISKELREKISNLGVSHLLAISGFHLGFLSILLFFIFSTLYNYYHRRFFPYRNRKFDLTVTILVLLFGYIYLLDFTPSIVRSYAMIIFGFLLLVRYIDIFSFEFLAVVVLSLIAIDIGLVFSVGFWFSVAGVFYIYLFLHHFRDLSRAAIFILINFWVFFAMIVIVHYIFDKFTFLQLLSPFLSILFTLFYPLELFLHLINMGGVLDKAVLSLLNMESEIYHIKTPLWYLILYVLVSLAAIRYKKALYLLVLMGFGVFLL